MESIKPRSSLLLPEESSTLLAVVAFLFVSGGAFVLIAITAGLVGKVLGWGFAREITLHPVGLSLNALVAGGYIWTGVLLYRAKRAGGYIALAVLSLSVIAEWFGSPAPTWSQFVVPVLSLLAILASWRHLTPQGRERAAHTSIAPRKAG